MSDERDTNKKLTRRNFLKTTGAVAATGIVAGALNIKSTAEAAPLPKKWDEAYDVVIIGSGFAGLAAA